MTNEQLSRTSDKYVPPRYNEFELLYQNMKYGLTATKELVDFFKERSSLEESYSKSLLKLAKIAANANCNGNFAPYWQILKVSSEKLGNIHLQMTQKVGELVKDLAKYAEELQRKHKSVKEGEAGTLEVVQQIQNSTTMTLKTKKIFQQRSSELEKAKGEGASQKEVEKVEGKVKKAGEEYKLWLDKWQGCREEYGKKMPVACRNFEEVETSHLDQMKEFVGVYAQIMEGNQLLIEQVNREFREECGRWTVEKMMEVLKGKTGGGGDDSPMLVDVMGGMTPTTGEVDLLGNGGGDSLIIGGLGGGGGASSGFGDGGSDKGSLNGGAGQGAGDTSKYNTVTSGSSLAAVMEKKKEGNEQVEGGGEGSQQTKTKGSRRTTSLLNLFIPLSSQGSKGSNSNSSSTFSSNKQQVSSAGGGGGGGGTSNNNTDSPNFETNSQGLPSSTNQDKSSLQRSSGSRGSKCPEMSSGFVAYSPIVRRSLTGTTLPSFNNNNNSKDHQTTITSIQTTAATPTPSNNDSLPTKVLGFLRSRRGKKKDKKRGKNKKDGNGSGKEDKSDGDDKDESQKSETPTAEIDEEGYTVRPKNTWENDKSSFYSSSDTDSDDEREKRLHIEIKPLSNGTAPLSASVDELRSTVEQLTLSPAGMTGTFTNTLKSRKLLHDPDSQMKRSQSVSQQIGSSSPPSRHPYTPLSPPIPPPNPRSSPKLPGQPGDPAAPPGVPGAPSSSANRYADLGDLFSDMGGQGASFPRSTPTPTSNTTTIPRPTSRPRPEGLGQRTSTNSPSPAISRTESIASLERGGIMAGIIGSRGPSPLTLGMQDTIPLAVAFHEIVHASFKGNDETLCQVKMTGDMMVSFPAGIIQVFANNPSPAQLSFQVRSLQPLDNLVSNKELVTVEKVSGGEGGDGVGASPGGSLNFEFNMSALVVLLKNHAEQNPSASYFNIDILKYHITPKSGASSCPLHLVAFWKCEPSQTDLRIDYKYNSHAMATHTPVPSVETPGGAPGGTFNAATTTTTTYPSLLQVCVAAPVDGGVKSMQSKPSGQWFPNTNRACWKIPALSYSHDNQGIGSLRARFEISSGPSSAGTIAAQFSCENSTLSGCDFQLSGTGYRSSLIKKRFVSGKYTCEAVDSASRYAYPPGPSGDSAAAAAGVQV